MPQGRSDVLPGMHPGTAENLVSPILSLVLKGELGEHRETEMRQYLVRCTESGRVCGVEWRYAGSCGERKNGKDSDTREMHARRVVSWTKSISTYYQTEVIGEYSPWEWLDM